MRPKKEQEAEVVTNVLKDLMIVHLGLAGVQQRAIRSIVRCDMNRVTRIVRHFKTSKKGANGDAS